MRRQGVSPWDTKAGPWFGGWGEANLGVQGTEEA